MYLTKRNVSWMLAALLSLSGCGGSNSNKNNGISSSATEAIDDIRTISGTDKTFSDNFSTISCFTFDLPRDMRAVCGYVKVPEDHENPGKQTIKIPVAYFPAIGKVTQNPVIYLSGGPGGAGISVHGAQLLKPFLQNSDVILFDQRGTGESEPDITCYLWDIDESETESEKIMSACRDELLGQNIHIEHYNSVQNAKDIAVVAQALEIEKLNLLGISYGTRLALEAMRQIPDYIDKVLIDSVYPQHILAEEEGPINFLRSLDLLFADCEEGRCGSAYTDLENTFYSLIESLNKKPKSITLTINHSFYGYKLTGDYLATLVFNLLYSPSEIEILPMLINQIDRGDYELLETIASALESYYSDSFSAEMHFAVQCQEEIPFNSVDKLIASVEGNSFFDEDIAMFQEREKVCKGLFNSQVIDGIKEPVSSNIDTLLFSGAYDPITPPKWANSALEYLENGKHYSFINMSHGAVAYSSCALDIAQSFFAGDGIDNLDDSCMDDIVSLSYAQDRQKSHKGYNYQPPSYLFKRP